MIALALAVSACAGPIAEPEILTDGTHSPSTSASPSASPEPEPVPAELVFLANAVVVQAGDGSEPAAVSLVTERDELIDTFIEALGDEPSVSVVPAMHEQRAGTSYDWDGLAVYLADGQYPEFAADITGISVTASSINGISLRTGAGVAVGGAAEELESEVELGIFDGLSYYLTESIIVGTGADVSSDPDFTLEWSVAVVTDGTVVTRFSVPSTNYGV